MSTFPIQEKNTLFSEQRIKFIVISILSLYPLVGMGIDLIAPSLPAISHTLHTSNYFSKNLITFYLFGYMLGNLLIGFLSDSIGRRNPLLIGLFVFSLVSLLPAVFNKPIILLFSRFLQGISIAAFAISSRAILSDILPKEKLLRAATLIATMWGIGPICGPMIGGYLQYYFNWQMGFYFFALMGLLGFLVTLFVIPETHFHKQNFQVVQIKKNFISIVKHFLFLGTAILMGISYSLLIVFNTLGPFLIQNTLGYSPVFFGHIALCMGITFLLGTFICRYLLKQFLPENIFSYAIPIFTLIALMGVVFAVVFKNNILVIIITSLFMFLGCGIMHPTAMGKGLSLFRHLAGSASAVMNLVNITISGTTAYIMSFIQAKTILSIIIIYLVLMSLASIIYLVFLKSDEITT